MVMSWFTRNAADHARGTGTSRRFARCTLDRVDGVGETVMDLSVVAVRLSMRSMNPGFSETISAGTSFGSF